MRERNLSPHQYLIRRCARTRPTLTFRGSTVEDWRRWRAALLPKLRELLGEFPSPVPLRAEIVAEQRDDDLIRQRVLLDTEPDMSVAALVYIPARRKPDKRLPAILCAHGHGPYGKDAVMGVLRPDDPAMAAHILEHNYDYGLQMARRGFVTCSLDWRGFGERSDPPATYPGHDECDMNYLRGHLLGVNLLTLQIHDGLRALDYLQSRPEIDPQRIGCMGLSYGGTMTTWLSLLDERIKAADIICYADTFPGFGIDLGHFCGAQIVPGLYAACDLGDLAGLIAPRPLLIEAGLHDTCFLYKNARVAIALAESIYRAAGAADRLTVEVFDGGHKFAGGQAFEFFRRNL